MILLLAGCVFITAQEIVDKTAVPTPTGEPPPTPVVDADQDGVLPPTDCDDTDPNIFPGADERANQEDDDCDGTIDEGTIFYDDDGDGFCEQLPCAADCGLSDCSGDCDDTKAAVYPGAPELCDGLSNDCLFDGDEFDDRDGDGWSVAQGDPDDRDVTEQPLELHRLYAESTCAVARVEAGTFTMGCAEPYCAFDEQPEHEVTITYDLLVMETEIQRKLWDRMLGAKNWAFPDCGPTCPVTRVSFTEALELANQLNDFYGLPRCQATDDPLTCEGWRLPTEAEWEWAARGNSNDRYSGGSNGSLVGWVQENAAQQVHPSRLKLPNDRGLYDMTGNVWEWVWDFDAPYPIAAVTDPVVLEADDPLDANLRRLRGGSARTGLDYAHVTVRTSIDADAWSYDDTGDDAIDQLPVNPFNYHGFRLVRRAP